MNYILETKRMSINDNIQIVEWAMEKLKIVSKQTVDLVKIKMLNITEKIPRFIGLISRKFIK